MNRPLKSAAVFASAVALICAFNPAAQAVERLVLAGTTGDAAIVAKVTPTTPNAPALGMQAAGAPACARKVKMVYSGYGEADRASCPPASAGAMR
jgi:hypothetical protein